MSKCLVGLVYKSFAILVDVKVIGRTVVVGYIDVRIAISVGIVDGCRQAKSNVVYSIGNCSICKSAIFIDVQSVTDIESRGIFDGL